jgi:hypothetical protein
MDKDCIVYDGYMVYRVATTRGVRFVVDQGSIDYSKDPSGQKVEDRFIIPMFKIANGIVRTHNWNGDTSGEPEGNDYQCLKENVDASKEQFSQLGEHPIKTTLVIVGDDGYYGIAVFPGIVIARIKEEAISLHC